MHWFLRWRFLRHRSGALFLIMPRSRSPAMRGRRPSRTSRRSSASLMASAVSPTRRVAAKRAVMSALPLLAARSCRVRSCLGTSTARANSTSRSPSSSPGRRSSFSGATPPRRRAKRSPRRSIPTPTRFRGPSRKKVVSPLTARASRATASAKGRRALASLVLPLVSMRHRRNGSGRHFLFRRS